MGVTRLRLQAHACANVWQRCSVAGANENHHYFASQALNTASYVKPSIPPATSSPQYRQLRQVRARHVIKRYVLKKCTQVPNIILVSEFSILDNKF